MTGILGIDAAWTEKEPSGIALLEGSPGSWRCVTVTPSYDSFLALAEGTSVDWTIRARGAVPEAGRLVAAAERLLDGQKIAVVTVDMPLSTEPILGVARPIPLSPGSSAARAAPSTRRAPSGPGRSARKSGKDLPT